MYNTKSAPLAMGIGEIERIYKTFGGSRSPQESIPAKQGADRGDWLKKPQGIRIGVYTNQFSEESKTSKQCQAQPKSSTK